MSDEDEYQRGFRVEHHRDGDELTVAVDLLYPSYDARKTTLRIGLESVRAVDDMRMWFSMERNEWVVEMKPVREDERGGTEVVGDWREVATIPAWLEGKPGETCQHERVNGEGQDRYCDICGEGLAARALVRPRR